MEKKIFMFNYSIIIPYRDNLSMLETAVNSIPDRDDIQIVIVDNSVTPLQPELHPQKARAKILMLQSDPTMGAGRARNVGLTEVKGQYIIFCDGDDYFTNYAFEVFDRYVGCDYDIVYFEADSIKLSSGEPSNRNAVTNDLVEEYLATCNEDLVRYGSGVPWCKMFRTEFVVNSGIKFGETRVSNDALFSMYTGYAAQKIAADRSKVYVVTEGEANTSLTKTRTAENQFIRYQVALERYIFLDSIGKRHMAIYPWVFTFQAWREFGFAEAKKYYQYAKGLHVNFWNGFTIKYIIKRIYKN